MIRAKFVVDRVVRQVRAPMQTEVQTVVLVAARGGGEIQLDTPPETVDQFVLGQTYSVDFTRD